MREKELKPCPFCGKEPVTSNELIDGAYYCTVDCDVCSFGMCSAGYVKAEDAEDEIIERWNKRV